MQIGYFAFNASNGISMINRDNTLWEAKYENFLWLIKEIEKIDYDKLFLLPIARWIGSGKEKLTGDAVETTSLASILLSQSRINIFSTVHTFAYKPQAIAHSSVFLNETFSNRYGINLVSGWKEDELNYFGINNIELENRYKNMGLWVEEFKNSEMQYSRLRNLENFIPTTLLNAAFSEEGRKFANKYVDHLFSTLPNNITDAYYDWPMSEQNFETFLKDKYTNPDAIHHYETTQSSGKTKANGPDDYSYLVEVNSDAAGAQSVSNRQYEQRIQDEKRQINLLNPSYLNTFIEEFNKLVRN